MSNYSEYLANWFRWRAGRQNPGYKKMLLLANPFFVPFDIYLLRFEEGAEIAPHTDNVETGRHFRLNLVLQHPKSGGTFRCEETMYESNRIKVFRPDLNVHSVSRIVSGRRYVLSIGWVLGDRRSEVV